MSLFVLTEHDISSNIHLTIIDIESMTLELEEFLDKNFVQICEGNSESSLSTVKKHVKELFSNKNHDWAMGAIAEFFIHLYIGYAGLKQECLFLNLEEGSIKKGFDGVYSKDEMIWIMESKAGSINTVGITHSQKVLLAMKDLENKFHGKTKNNPWLNAYRHVNLADVGTEKGIQRKIKKLADDFTNGQFPAINDFNTMPCGTVFLSGIWNEQDHDFILSSIKGISHRLQGKEVYVVCVTQHSVNLFQRYLEK